MTVLLDIAGALFVRGAIIAIMLTATAAMNETLYFKTAYKTVQTDLTNTIEIMESDFLKIGYNVGQGRFQVVDTSRVVFLADLSNDGTPDSVEYFLSDALALLTTPNPKDRFLYRKINGGTSEMVGVGITRLYLRYFKESGLAISNPNDPQERDAIIAIHAELRAEHGTYAVKKGDGSEEEIYPEVYWRRYMFITNR
jgi:hypothetical protein